MIYTLTNPSKYIYQQECIKRIFLIYNKHKKLLQVNKRLWVWIWSKRVQGSNSEVFAKVLSWYTSFWQPGLLHWCWRPFLGWRRHAATLLESLDIQWLHGAVQQHLCMAQQCSSNSSFWINMFKLLNFIFRFNIMQIKRKKVHPQELSLFSKILRKMLRNERDS